MNGQTSPTNPPGVALHHGQQATKAVRMGRSASTGRNLSRHIGRTKAGNDWPGRAYGIRQPNPAETPLSWHEVNHFLDKGAYQ